MDYIGIQEMVIRQYNITIERDSKCWKRTHCHPKERKVCKWNQANSYPSLMTLLHEIGHIETDRNGMKRCEQESEATRWAVAKLRELGLPIKRKVVSSYQAYIKMTYERGVRRGLSKRIKNSLYF